jgi:hypothetical protein
VVPLHKSLLQKEDKIHLLEIDQSLSIERFNVRVLTLTYLIITQTTPIQRCDDQYPEVRAMAAQVNDKPDEGLPPLEGYIQYSSVTRSAERLHESEQESKRQHDSKGTFWRDLFKTLSTTKSGLAVISTPDAKTAADVPADVGKNKDLDSRPRWGALDGADSALRGARIATWGNVAFLIATDVFGPSAAPYVLTRHTCL